MTDNEKDELLVEIVNTYRDVIFVNFNGNVSIMDLIDRDIEIFLNTEEFEAAQAITDIKNTIIQILNEQ